jgi:uncharacterized phage protein gp47/JayE
MTIAAPIIEYPMTNWTGSGTDKYYTSELVQNISGVVPVSSADLQQQGTLITVEFRYRITAGGSTSAYSDFTNSGITVGSTLSTITEIPWSLNTEEVVSFDVNDTVEFEFKTVKRISINQGAGYVFEESTLSKITVGIIAENKITASVIEPTGTKVERAKDYIKVFVPVSSLKTNNNNDLVGVNFYIALDAGGGVNGYQKMNQSYVVEADVSETVNETLEVSETEDTANNITVTTTKTRQVQREYVTYTVNSTVLNRLVSENKIRNVFLDNDTTLNPDITYYFVTTAVSFDKSLNQVVESIYSIELEGKFIEYVTGFQSIPQRTNSDVIFSITRTLTTDNNTVNVIGGSVVRDVLDPVSLEFSKYYIIQDFVFKTLSVDTLIEFDDADGDGITDPIETSIPKRNLADALGIRDGTNLQLIINEQFDKRAANYNITRRDPIQAKGKVVFFTTNTPTNDILIPAGTQVSTAADPTTNTTSVAFTVVGTKIIDSTNPEFYFNPTLRRYEVEADVIAVNGGTQGNVPAGAINRATGLPSNLEVTNIDPTDYGAARETNRELSERIKLAIAGVDTGTEGGYEKTSESVPGVEEARVEKAGDELMVRDFDTSSNEHVGGKVDIYLKGRRSLQYIDQVAFKFEQPTDVFGKLTGERFFVINASDFRVQTQNPKVTANNPIVSVSGVRNVTRGRDYSLDGYRVIGDGDTILLESNQANLAIGMATLDVIEVNYSYRSSNVIQLTHQPVLSIESVADSDGNLINETEYRLVKLEDPLLTGESSISKYGIEFLFDSQNDVTEFRQIDDEQHDMFLNIPVSLSLKGVDVNSVEVVNVDDDSIVYQKDIDYSVTRGTQTISTQLNLLQNSAIRQGQRVSVSYRANENFEVTYTANALVEQVQEEVDKKKHADADAIVKQGIGNYIDISARVIKDGRLDSRYLESDRTVLKSRIQTAIANYVQKLKMGETFTQSSLVNVIRNVPGVKDVRLPLIRMMKRNGSFIPLDDLGSLSFEVFQKTSSSGVPSYRTLDSVLTYRTSENGGPDYLFRTVYEDNIGLMLVDDPTEVAKAPVRAYIQADGRLIVSTRDGAPPQSKYYKAAYYVLYPNDVNIADDIDTSEIEYLVVDSASLKDLEIVTEQVTRRGL